MKLRYYFILAVTWLVYFSPFIFLGTGAYITIHDNLDSNVPLYRLIASDPYFFHFSVEVKEIMGGLPKSSLPSDLNIISLLYYIFPPFTAYVINEVLIRLVAFMGMYWMLNLFFSASKHVKETSFFAA